MQLRGAAVAITGTSKDIGRETAPAFARASAHIVGGARDLTALAEVQAAARAAGAPGFVDTDFRATHSNRPKAPRQNACSLPAMSPGPSSRPPRHPQQRFLQKSPLCQENKHLSRHSSTTHQESLKNPSTRRKRVDRAHFP
jgi:hypothetical protein